MAGHLHFQDSLDRTTRSRPGLAAHFRHCPTGTELVEQSGHAQIMILVLAHTNENGYHLYNIQQPY